MTLGHPLILYLSTILWNLSFHGTTSNTVTYKSYQTEVICHPSYPIEYPATLTQVQEIVRRAIRLQTTVKAFGSRHSVSDSICTSGIPIDMSGLNYTTIDQDTQVVKVGAGAQLADFLAVLELEGRALGGHVPSFGGVTIGGALGKGARGSTLLHKSSLSDQVIGVTLVDGLGEVRVIDESSPDNLSAVRVHLGLLGILIDVSFPTVPAYKMKVENYPESEKILLDGSALEMARSSDWFQIWWFPSSESVVVSKGSFVPNGTPGKAKTYNIPEISPLTGLSLRRAFEEGQRLRSQTVLRALQLWSEKSLYEQIPLRQPVFSEDGGQTLVNPAVGYVHGLMMNRCSSCAWDLGPQSSIYPQESAFALDLSQFDEMIKTVKDIVRQVPVSFPIYGIFIRFAPESDSLMAVEYGRPTVHIEIVCPMREDPFSSSRAGLAAIQAIEQAMVFNLGGRPHFSMCGLVFHTTEMEERNSKNIGKFRTYMTKYDPNKVFMNNFGKRILGVSNDLTMDPRVQHCALQEYCFCTKNSDCATGQVCKKLNGFNVCKDILLEILPSLGLVSDQLSSSTVGFLGSII